MSKSEKFMFFRKEDFKNIKGPAVLHPGTYRQLYYDLEADKGKVIMQVSLSKPKKRKRK